MSGAAVAATQLVNGDKLIRPGTLSGNRLRSHSITGKQVDLAKLGTVPSARSSQTAQSSETAQSAETATTATNAQTATTAQQAESLPPLVWQGLALEDGWDAYTSPAGGAEPQVGYPGLQFAKDAEGFVHLRGVIESPGAPSEDVTILPSGYRPPDGALVSVMLAGYSAGPVPNFSGSTTLAVIEADGEIFIPTAQRAGFSGGPFSFEGVEFDAG